ncbi:MAG TPA: asparagine synthase (glutamine-hydrolyzing) [Accumulibacter sp.]|jgi:asparagine synthase (glutamine-hydrolyzing)|nr:MULTISPECIES: asparagine synthase (glutamine-hydrolyzing) [unclassified Candidatus Accumulibacter]HRE72434.1 asparagine synthase (glutamine-hydrolyzing) [Accumulibacter sp.]
MCGFVASLGPGDPLPLTVLNRMRDRLAHRGPDGADSWTGTHERGSISMGFRRLAILDTRHVADQPMRSNDGRKMLVFNGEIYNFIELRAELEAVGRQFRTRGDSEVLLQAYEQWGESMIERLNGMFAFVLWDQDRGRALVARDRFGEKPLFMCRLPGGQLAFASEIKALLAHPEADSSYNLDMFSKVLFGRLIFSTEETLFKGVRQVRAGHCMLVDADGSIVFDKRHWTPAYDRSLGRLSKREQITEFRSLLERSVAQRMRSDVPVTACLSGGLDSSSLVALLANQKEAGSRIEAAMSVRFPNDLTIDEGSYIDLMLHKTGLVGHSVNPTPEQLTRDVRRLHWHHETIIPGPSMYLEWALMRDARARGYKVIIDGQGADEVLAGYQCHLQAWQVELAHQGKLGHWYAQFVGYQRDRRLRHAASRYANPERRFVLRDSLPAEEFSVHMHSYVADWERNYGGDGLPAPGDVGVLRFELALNLMRTSLPSNLYSGDRNSMAHGIECRYPFLDYALVDFATHLPDWAYLHNAWGKNILRRALRDMLPREVRWRADKVGFAAPQDEWVRNSSLKDWVSERVTDTRLAAIPGHNGQQLMDMWEAHQRGEADNSSWLWCWASAAELIDMQASREWTTHDE